MAAKFDGCLNGRFKISKVYYPGIIAFDWHLKCD